MSLVAEELRILRQEIVKVNARIARMRMSGVVAERDTSKWRIRLNLGEDPETGKKILSPWIKPQAVSSGALKISPSLPEVGDKGYVVSVSGIIGADSIFEPAAFDDETKRPDQEADETVIEKGNARIAIKDGSISLSIGGKGFTLNAEGLAMSTVFRAKGGSKPATFKGGVDSNGDVNMDGNDNVLI